MKQMKDVILLLILQRSLQFMLVIFLVISVKLIFLSFSEREVNCLVVRLNLNTDVIASLNMRMMLSLKKFFVIMKRILQSLRTMF